MITSRKNANVRVMRELLREKESRRERLLFAAEGDHLCGEAALLAKKGDIELFLYTEKAAKKYPETFEKALEKSESSECISDELSEYISDTKSPQGLFCAAKQSLMKTKIPESAKKIIILDGLQDPGNVGAIIRAAEALGFDGAAFTTEFDLFSPKVLRSSMGSSFRLPQEFVKAKELKKRFAGFSIFAAMLDESAARLGEIKFPEKAAVVIGSEGAGVSAKTAALCAGKIYIPIKGAESLNAASAAAIIMWEMINN